MPLKRLMALPEGFPNNAPPAKFRLGARVLLTPDFGTVTGMEYAPAKHLKGWGWRLAEMHFLWEEYERIPPQLQQQLCPTPRNGKFPSP